MFGMIPFDMRNDLSTRDDGFDRLFNWMNRPLSSFFNDVGFTGKAFNVDVKDNGNSYELKAELPGVSKDNISLSYKDNYLTISNKQDESKEEKDENGSYIRRERYSGSMSRSFYIDNVDEAKCQADFKDGILTVTMPKVTVMKDEAPRQIPIHTS